MNMRASLEAAQNQTPRNQTSGKIQGTTEQQLIWEDMLRMRRIGYGAESRGGHIITNAVAGSGKTFTAIEGAKRLRAGGVRCDIRYMAFNKSVQVEMQERAQGAVNAITFHSAGYKAVQNAFGRVKVESGRMWSVLDRVPGLGKDRVLRGGLKKLIGLVKQYGVGAGDNWQDEVWGVVDRHGLVLSDTGDKDEEIVSWVPKVLEAAMEVRAAEGVDFDDMIWLPYAHNLELERSEVLLVDEAQDLNVVQQWFAERAGERVLVIGDRNQAIYGFRGADNRSMDNLAYRLGGCVERLLSYTRRCPVKVVEAAQQYVPQIKAWEGASEGVVGECSKKVMLEKVVEGDMVLCRVNSPLIDLAYDLIGEGKPARIRGREIHDGILKLLEESGSAGSLRDVLGRASERVVAEVENLSQLKEGRGERRAQMALDRLNCLIASARGCGSVGELRVKLEELFAEGRAGIVLSSVHKAKGLEADRVWVIEPGLMPHPKAKESWEKEQERNLLYVAITRARRELWWVY
jgi:superfamily I DNA/RNA helicase